MTDGHQNRKTASVRVALLIESDGPGGAEAVVLALADGLRERGATVLPVVFADGEGWLTGRLRSAGFPVFSPTISRRIPFDISVVTQLVQWTRQERINVLHTHELMMGVYGGLVGAIARIPHLITLHGGTRFASAAHRRWAMKLSAMSASAIVGVSASTCEHISSALGLPRSRVTLVPNGVSVGSGSRDRTRALLALAPDEKLFLGVGNLYKVKGHAVLIEAATRLACLEGVPPWRIAIAGRGDEEATLRRMIQAAGLGDRVVLLGLRNDIPDLLAAADGWVMPSLSEGLPMALLEAMFAGLPTICTAVGGIPSLVIPGETGFLVPPSDPDALSGAILRLLSDAKSAKVLGANAKRLAEANYSLATMVERYLALYDNCGGSTV
jgi:glycosyltransferase involved in cell wall biosynthesis